MIYIEMIMDDLSTSSIFHVIDSKASYKLLLGQPWLHEHEIVASTLHQCLKFYRGRERKINDYVKPFTKVESQLDTRFFEEDESPKETILSTIILWEKVARKISFKCQRKKFPNNPRTRKKANRETNPLLSSKSIRRSLPLQVQHPLS